MFFPWPAAADSAASNVVASAISNNPDVALNEIALTEPAARFPTFEKPTTPLVVNISVNTVSKGDFFVEIDTDRSLYFRVEDILGLKMKIAQDRTVLIHDEKFTPLSAIRDAQINFDEKNLTVAIIGKTMEKQNTEIEFHPLVTRPPNVYYPSETSAFLNYGLTYIYTNPLGFQSFVAANKLGARTGDVFFVTDSLYTKTETSSNFVRLSSNVTYERKNDLQWLVVGDQFASSGDLGSIINIGGVGFSKVYKIDPYLITEQMFSLRGVTAYPSQAQIFMDGVPVSKNAVAPGSFELKNIYSYGGAHTVDVILTDPFGKEEKISYPMYFSPQLLREGLHEYSYNAGFLREQYGVKSNEYGKAAFSAFHRYGITSSVNIGARAEGTNGIYNGGLFASFTLPMAGSFSISFAGSSTNSEKGSAGIFQQSYQLGSFNTNLDVRSFSRGYATVGVQASDDRTKLQKSFSVGIPVSHLGGISLTVSEIETYNGIDMRTASATYSQSITRNTSLFATVSTSHAQDTTYGFFIGLNFTSAKNIHGAVQYNNTGGVNTETVQIQKDTPRGAGVGYQATLVRSDAGASTSYAANPSFTYNAPYGVYSLGAGILNANGNTTESVNIGVAGAFAYAGGFYGFARPVNDSFAIVMVGDVPNATVQIDGQDSGKTGSSGTMVVPELVSYNNNKITLDTKNMPMDYSLSEVNAAIAPSLWSGACVAFDAIKVRAVTGTVYGMKADKKIPLEYVDILMKVGDREVTSPTGKNGEFYIENTLPKIPDAGTYDKLSCRAIAERRKAGSAVIQPGTYRASAAYEGGKCEFSITFQATDDVITDLSEIRCVSP